MCEYDSKLFKLVADDTPKAIAGLVVVSSIFIWAYLDYIPLEYLFLWSLAQSAFIVFRHLNARALLRYIKEENPLKLRFHSLVFALLIASSAMIWSGGTLLGIVYAPTPYEFVGLIMILGIIAAALLSLTPIFNAFLVYFFIMILTQLGIMAYYGEPIHIAIVGFLLVYIPVIVLLSKSVYSNHLSTIKIQDTMESHINELRELSITDSLTKAYNRRHFFEAAQTLVSIAKREQSEISFLMIDIDYFKNINDTYGHQVGDYVLVRLSQEIQGMVRDSDVFARIGGEEFALLLHSTSLEGARIIAEKIRLKVEELDFEDNYIPFDLTISIGCSSLSDSMTTLEELYQEADKKLYIAKELGRNRVQ